MMSAVASLAGDAPSRRPRCASPVITEWFLAWADALGSDAGRQLAPYVQPLALSRGTPEDEVARQWLIVEWLLGTTLPTCLDEAGARDIASGLVSSSAVRSQRELVATASLVEEATRAARHAHDGWRQAAASLSGATVPHVQNRPPWRASPSEIRPEHSASWQGLCDGIRAAVHPVRALVVPAAAALGLGRPDASRIPDALRSAPVAVSDCLFAVAWSGCYRRLTSGAWSWDVPPSEASHAAEAAARRALRRVHARLDRYAHDLAAQLLAVTTARRPLASAWAS